MKLFPIIMSVMCCSLLTAEIPSVFPELTTSSPDSILTGIVEKNHCPRGKRGHRGEKGKRGHSGPIGPQGPVGAVTEYFSSAFAPLQNVYIQNTMPLPLGTVKVSSPGIEYDGDHRVTIQVPGKYLVEYSVSLVGVGSVPDRIMIDTHYGAGGTEILRDLFTQFPGSDDNEPYFVGSRRYILDLQQNDIVELQAIIDFSFLQTDSQEGSQAIVFTMAKIG